MWKEIFVGWCIKASIWRTYVIWVHLHLTREGGRGIRLFWSWFPHGVCSSTTLKPYSLPKVIVFYLICMGQRGIHSIYFEVQIFGIFWVCELILGLTNLVILVYYFGDNLMKVVKFGAIWWILEHYFCEVWWFFGLNIFNIFHYPNS
jgi:hypothetical protein